VGGGAAIRTHGAIPGACRVTSRRPLRCPQAIHMPCCQVCIGGAPHQ
jgi:hypothetical protein